MGYWQQIINNARALSNELIERGYDIVSGGTDNHVFLVDLTEKEITGKAAENALHTAGMTVNKNMVPFDTRSPMITSGIRLGTAALTTKGMKEEEMKTIAGLIDRVLSNVEDESIHLSVLEDVKELAGQFPLYDFWPFQINF